MLRFLVSTVPVPQHRHQLSDPDPGNPDQCASRIRSNSASSPNIFASRKTLVLRFRLAPSLPPPPVPPQVPLPPPPPPSRSQRRKRSRPRVGGGRPRASASGAAASRPAAGEAVTEAGGLGGSEFYMC
jgi:hypothetical protein